MEQHTEILLVSVWYSKQYIWGLWLAYSQHMKRLYLLEFLFCPASFWRLLNSAFSSMILRCLFSWKRSTSIGINNRTKSTWRKTNFKLTSLSFFFHWTKTHIALDFTIFGAFPLSLLLWGINVHKWLQATQFPPSWIPGRWAARKRITKHTELRPHSGVLPCVFSWDIRTAKTC